MYPAGGTLPYTYHLRACVGRFLSKALRDTLRGFGCKRYHRTRKSEKLIVY